MVSDALRHTGLLYRTRSPEPTAFVHQLPSCFRALLHCPDGLEYEEGEYDEDEEGGEYDEDEEDEGEDDYAESFLEPDDAVREVATGGTAWGDAVLKCAQEVLCQPNMQVGVGVGCVWCCGTWWDVVGRVGRHLGCSWWCPQCQPDMQVGVFGFQWGGVWVAAG